MKTAIVLTFGVTLLSFLAGMSPRDPAPDVRSPASIAATPSPKSLPTPACKPTPRPLSEAELNDPLRELDLIEAIDGQLGTPDVDCDGICNSSDNCILAFNPNQKDSNRDGKGDACDVLKVGTSFMDSRCDMDADGVPDMKDNCPLACNPDQLFVDKNGNKVNDLCDPALPGFVWENTCKKRKKVKSPRP